MRPGKPVLCAKLPGGLLVLALPGTPMAVAAGLRFIALPALLAMTGQRRETILHAVLDTPLQVKSGLRHFLRGSLRQATDGQWHACVSPQQQPFRIRPYAEADVWIVLQEDAGDCAGGTLVEVHAIEPSRLAPMQPPY
ncbi:MAG: hypothetical protein WDW36_008113 [Sanguina aurantia]